MLASLVCVSKYQVSVTKPMFVADQLTRNSDIAMFAEKRRSDCVLGDSTNRLTIRDELALPLAKAC